MSACSGQEAHAEGDAPPPVVAAATPAVVPTVAESAGPTVAASTETPEPTLVTETIESTETATPDATPTVSPTSPGAPEAVGTVAFYESSLTIPSYAVEAFQSDALSPVYKWPYRRTDIEAFKTALPAPVTRTYKTLILENRFLLITILPEFGGRVLQVEHKPTGTRMFYNNSVLKPTAWGPPEQSGWFALGGLEWDLPVEEHGYAWGEPWGYIPLVFSPERAAVTVFTPQDGRALSASITIELLADAGSFTVAPTITNVSGASQRFDFWSNAMLAPGNGASISPLIHFVLPTDSMMVHSTADVRLPAAGQQVSWPIYSGRDLSRLATWTNYAGLFEAPAAHGPFVALYDTLQDAGAVRTFPADVAQGSKIFALGGSDALNPALYTDDDSAYVELHGGLAPTFAQQTELPPGDAVSWRESWYPVAGMGDLDVANELAALHATVDSRMVQVTVFAAHAFAADLILLDAAGNELARTPAALSPAAPVHVAWKRAALASAPASVHVESARGSIIEWAFAD